MICSKGQLVRLTAEANVILGTRADRGTARVKSLTYVEQALGGERGVRLDRDLAGSCWWREYDLEPV